MGRICGDWLGGGNGRPARAALVAHVNLGQAQATAAGTVELGVRGGLARVTAATIERPATDANLRVALFDGARPLAESATVAAGSVPAAVQRMIAARDQGCRFPGSRDPSPTPTSTTSSPAPPAAPTTPTTSSPCPAATTR